MNLFQEIYNYREMIYNLVRKDLRGRYKGSVLGFLWTFINPLLQLVVYTVVFSIILNSGIEKYYLFLFVALIPWTFFSSCISGGCASIINEKNLVTKIYFPREVIPISYVTSAFMNMLFSFIIVLLVVFVAGDNVNVVAWVSLPVIMIVEYIFALGCTLLLSALTVYFRDIQHIMGIVSMAWQFLTPVMYSSERVPDELMPIFLINPMTSIINAYRDVLYYGVFPNFGDMIIPTIISVAVLAVGFLVFHKMQRNFVEEL